MIFILYAEERQKLEEDPGYQGGGQDPPYGPVCQPAKYSTNNRTRYLGMLSREWNRLYNPESQTNYDLQITPRALD